MKRILFVTDFHYCQDEYGEILIDEKAERLVKQINAEYEKCPFEYVLMLGDYSLDHWGWFSKGTYLEKGESYTARFFDRYVKNFPVPYFALAGNHEQYGEKKMIQAGHWSGISPNPQFPWGVRDLYLDENGLKSSYIVAEHKLYQNGEPYTVRARVQDEIEIKF